MNQLVAVMLGGALGAASRFWLSSRVEGWFGSPLPPGAGTFAVNVLGCLAMGLLVGAAARGGVLPEALRVPLTVGFLGAFTTYSAFGNDALRLLRDGQAGQALLYIGATTVFGIAAVWLGIMVSRGAGRVW